MKKYISLNNTEICDEEFYATDAQGIWVRGKTAAVITGLAGVLGALAGLAISTASNDDEKAICASDLFTEIIAKIVIGVGSLYDVTDEEYEDGDYDFYDDYEF